MIRIVFLSLIFLPVIAYEEVPLLIDTSVVNVEFEKDDKNLIQLQNMKRLDDVKRAKDEKNNFKNLKMKLDTKQIQHQRTLDYMKNHGSSTMLPIF